MVSWTIRRNWQRCIESTCDIPRYVYSIFGVIRDLRYEKVEVFMNKIESRAFLENLQIALTIVIGNDVIIPSIEQSEAIFGSGYIYGYIWRYKNCGVKVDLRTIVSAEILQHNALCDCVENTRAHARRELWKMLSKEANK